MDGWVRATTLDELWEGEMAPVTIRDREILLCNLGGEVFAFEDRCPHQSNPLSNGRLDEDVLTCAAHEWTFDVRRAQGINPPNSCLRTYPVRLDGETILLRLTEDGR